MCVCVRTHACVGTAGVYLRRKCSLRMSCNVDLLRHCLPPVVKKKKRKENQLSHSGIGEYLLFFGPGSEKYPICRRIAEHTGVK